MNKCLDKESSYRTGLAKGKKSHGLGAFCRIAMVKFTLEHQG